MEQNRRVMVYLRESVPLAARSQQLSVLGRMRMLVSTGVIDDLRIENWAPHVTDRDPLAEGQLAAYTGFETWARSHGSDIHPAFDAHDCVCSFTDESFRRTTFPVVCIAVYDGDELRMVYPHRGPTGPRTVTDGLEMLEWMAAPDAELAATDDADMPTA